MSTTVKPTTSDELEAELSVVKDTGNKGSYSNIFKGLKSSLTRKFISDSCNQSARSKEKERILLQTLLSVPKTC
jgi:hypothetical protein